MLRRPADDRSLTQLVLDELVPQPDNPVVDESAEEPAGRTAAAEDLLYHLDATLAEGRMVLVVAAPTVPEPVRRVMRYLNAQGQRLFGVEYRYFSDHGVEVFVASVVVAPRQRTLWRRRLGETADRANLDPYAMDC